MQPGWFYFLAWVSFGSPALVAGEPAMPAGRHKLCLRRLAAAVLFHGELTLGESRFGEILRLILWVVDS